MLKANRIKQLNTLLPNEISSLILGRLALIFLLLILNWWWMNTYPQLPINTPTSNLNTYFLGSILLSFIYLLAHKISSNYALQIRLQFVIDVILITLIVSESGSITSPYITLYVVLLSVAGFYLGKNGTLFIAGLCSMGFTLTSVVTALTLDPFVSKIDTTARDLQIIGLNNVAILVVGLLASRFSERRKINEKLLETAADFADFHVLHQRIVELIPSGLIIADTKGTIHSFNRAAENISGIENERIIGQNVFALFGEDIRSVVAECLNDKIETDLLSEQFETTINKAKSVDNTDKQVTVACSVSSLIGKNGGIYGLIITFQDMTKIRAMEETIRRSDRLAAVGRMAAGLAHEIRNPLGSMSSALQFLSEKSEPENSDSDLMDVVICESERLDKIISNFLSYAHPSADLFVKDEYQLNDICKTIKECLTLLRHSPELSSSHILDFELPKNPVRIRSNETQLKQVFWNLSRNSIQAMPKGGKLSVKLNKFNEKNILIVFEDTGKGIEPEYLEHLFEPFLSGTNGTGLGLSIVHKIVCDHGGHIDIKSDPGVGTTVTVELPC